MTFRKKLHTFCDLCRKNSDLVSNRAADLSKTITVEQIGREALLEHGEAELRSLHTYAGPPGKIDTRMEDCMAILGGYTDHIESPQVPEEEASEQEEENDEG